MHSSLRDLLISPAEMAAIDLASAQSGIDSFLLMRGAGLAVAAAVLRSYPQAHRYVMLCGPGNNGGDGYVAASALTECGANVAVFAFGDPDALSGDAARARQLWSGAVHPLEALVTQLGDVVVDALFGAGLTRDLPDAVAKAIDQINAEGLPILAVDLPTGVDGRTGQIRGAAFAASHTITFMTRKPGHLLLPGRSLCGALDVFDIGIPARIVLAVGSRPRVNVPALWSPYAARLDASSHKYRRGHLVVFSGGAQATGAARLSAAAGLAAGAGLVTVASPKSALDTNAAQLTAVMLKEVDDRHDLENWLQDSRLGAFVLGPGFGIGNRAREFALALCDRALVLDADGIASFQEHRAELFERLSVAKGRVVMTPHEGEFARLFPEIARDQRLSKIEKAQAAAEISHATIVYKGADTVIASPDGKVAVNANAPPSLATAGSGDVLAGIIGAHLAQGMPAFEAAAAGVWRHGAAGTRAGAGLTAETLVTSIPPLG